METFSLALDAKPVIEVFGSSHHDETDFSKFRLEGFWGLHFYHYYADLTIAGLKVKIEPGCVGLTPPNQFSSYTWNGPIRHDFVHFAVEPSVKTTEIPAMTNLGNSFEEIHGDFMETARWYKFNPARASARLWDILWKIVGFNDAKSNDNLPPALISACDFIEYNLSKSIFIEDLCKTSQVSHNHLNRLFQKKFSCSVTAYIRQKRVDLAEHLAKNTDLALKVIAIEVGLPDLQLFNKTVRKVKGMSPRELRKNNG